MGVMVKGRGEVRGEGEITQSESCDGRVAMFVMLHRVIA